jgi:hypothetical protein
VCTLGSDGPMAFITCVAPIVSGRWPLLLPIVGVGDRMRPAAAEAGRTIVAGAFGAVKERLALELACGRELDKKAA